MRNSIQQNPTETDLPPWGACEVIAWGVLVLVMALVAVAGFAAPLRGAEPACYIPIDVRSVHILDADTIRCDVLLPWGVTLRNRTIRLDYDACEVSRIRQGVHITDAEIERGKDATESLLGLLKHSEAAYLVPLKRSQDNFGRLLGGLFLKIRTEPQLLDVRVWMEAHKYVREEP